MKSFDTLYKRTKTGAIQVWSIYATSIDATCISITKVSGQFGSTSPIKHFEDVTQGKQNRTIAQQAELQMESDWKSKRDEGYKTQEDLGIKPANDEYVVHDHIDGRDIPHYGTLAWALERQLPQFNTAADGSAKPMLAHPVKWDKVVYPQFAERKLDGHRCMITIDVTGITFRSRNGKTISTLPHLEQILRSAYKNLLDQYDSVILDGELYSHELSFQEITRAVKKKSADSVKIKFNAYDVYSAHIQSRRKSDLSNILATIDDHAFTEVDSIVVHNREEAMELHNKWVQEGFEGLMLRDPNGLYESGQRSRKLLKVKEFDEEEFILHCIEIGKRPEDVVLVLFTDDAREFRAKLMGDAAYKAEVVKNATKLKGNPVTVKYFGRSDDNIPRFPIAKAIRDYE